MPDSTKATAPTPAWDPRQLFGASQQALAAWTRCASAMTEEMTHFVQARWQEDMGAWTRLASCKDPGEAFQCQCHFAEKAVADYLDEAGKLSRLALSIANPSAAAEQHKA